MSDKRSLARAVCVALGAQALAVAALAQTPDTNTTQRPSDTSTSQSSTTTNVGVAGARGDDAATTRTSDTSTRTGDASTTTRTGDTNTSTRTRTADQSTSTTSSSRSQSGDHASMDHSKMDHSKDHSNMKPVDAQSFAKQAALSSMAEIELAQIALNNTKNEEIRLYAERMVKDHTAANTKLKTIASKQNIQLPNALDSKHQQAKQQLSNLKDAAFDREYKKHMNKSHDEAVALFESASQTQQMPNELKDFAASTLPTLEKHKKLAEGLDAKEGA